MKKIFTTVLIIVAYNISIAQINTTSFAPKIDYVTGTGSSNSVGITNVDLDNDGKPEVISGNAGNSSISIYRNTSTLNQISLSVKVDYSTANPVNFIHPIDLDGDGKTDLVTCVNTGTTFSIFRNTTSTIGTITFATRQDIVGINPANFDIADVDGDSKPDLVCVNYSTTSFSVYRNTSTIGTISFATRVDFSCGSSPTSIALYDMDGDNKNDVAITNYTSGQVAFYRNNTSSIGSPSFTTLITTVATGSYPHFIKYADLDNDGKKDLVTGNFYGNNISVIKNNSTLGSLIFQAAVNFTSGTTTTAYCQGVNLTDFDNDGKIDIGVCNNGNNSISIFKNISLTGSINLSSFSSQVIFSTNTSPVNICSSDLNGDGRKDICVINNGSNNISIFRNQILSSEPTVSASNLVFSNTNSNSTTLTFTKGNGNRRIVLAKATSAVSASPLDSFAYNPKDTFGLGTQIGTGNYVVYSDTGNTVNVKGLSPGTNYYFAIYEYNGTGAYSNYLSSPILTGNLLIGYSYFSKSSGNLNTLSTWGTNADGTGTNPSSFSNNNTSYNVVNNGSPTISADWFITGSNTLVVFGDGTNSGNFNIPAGLSFGVDSFYASNNITFTIQGNIYTNKAGFHLNSIAQYVLNTPQNLVTAKYGNLIISGSTKTILGNVTVKGVLAMFNNINCNGYTLTLGESVTQTGTLNRSSGIIIGNFKRWFATNVNTGITGLMPIGTSTIYRPIQVNYTSIPSSGGTLTANFITGSGGNAGFPIFDFTTSPIVQLTKTGFEGYWRLTPSDGLTGGAYTCTATGTGFSGINSVSDLRLVRRNISASSWSLAGTSVLGSGTVAIPVVSITGITNIGGEFSIASDSSINPLPVKWISFNGKWEANDIILNWQTASEENNNHFEIEKLNGNEWKKIGIVKGNGNSMVVNSYSFMDNTIFANNEQNSTLNYRLKQVDFNGNYIYSNIISIAPQSANNSISLFPNPMQNVLQVNNLENESVAQIIIYDMNGKEIMQANNQQNIDVSNLTKGLYIIKVVTDKQIFTGKVAK